MNNFANNSLKLLVRAFYGILVSIALFIYSAALMVVWGVFLLIRKISTRISDFIPSHLTRLYSELFGVDFERKFDRKSINTIDESMIEEIVDYLFEKKTFIIEEVIEHFGWGKRYAEKVRGLLEEMEVVFKDKENKNTTTLWLVMDREEVLQLMLENIENFK